MKTLLALALALSLFAGCSNPVEPFPSSKGKVGEPSADKFIDRYGAAASFRCKGRLVTYPDGKVRCVTY